MKLLKIVGISGTNGAGKDTLGRLLAERKNYKFVSGSDILRAELTRQGLSHERHNMRALSTKWANEHGHGVISLKIIEAYVAEEEREGYDGLAFASIRRVAEAEVVHEAGGVVVWVDADRRLRYERLQKNDRGRADDKHSFEEWSRHEDIELKPIEGEPGSMNMLGVKELADIHIDNNFSTYEEFQDYLIKEFEL